jgi:hypothetical protein
VTGALAIGRGDAGEEHESFTPREPRQKYVEFRLASKDISTVRFGLSPGHEIVHAVRTLSRPQEQPLQWG